MFLLSYRKDRDFYGGTTGIKNPYGLLVLACVKKRNKFRKSTMRTFRFFNKSNKSRSSDPLMSVQY